MATEPRCKHCKKNALQAAYKRAGRAVLRKQEDGKYICEPRCAQALRALAEERQA